MQAASESTGQKCVCVSCKQQTTIGFQKLKATVDEGLSVACPVCQKQLEYQPRLIGTKGFCHSCNEVFVLPAARQKASRLQLSIDAIVFKCGTCEQIFEGLATQIGKKGRCPACTSVFTIRDHRQSQPKAEAVLPEQISASLPAIPVTPAIAPFEISSVSEATRLGAKLSAAAKLGKPIDEPATTPKPVATNPVTPTTKPFAAKSQTAKPQTAKPQPSEPSKAKSASQPTRAATVKISPIKQPARPISAKPHILQAEPIDDDPIWSVAGDPGGQNFNGGGFGVNPYQHPNGHSLAHQPAYRKPGQLSFTGVISHTFDHLIPGMFFLYLPMLAVILTNGIGYGLFFLLVKGPQWIGLPTDWIVMSAVAGLVAYVLINFAGIILFYPSYFTIALTAVRGRKLETDLMQVDSTIAGRFFGYILLQALCTVIILAPFFLILFLSALSRSLLLLVPSWLLLTSAMLAYSKVSMIGAFAIVDDKSIGEAFTSGFKIVFQNLLVMIGLTFVEIFGMILLVITIFGPLFFGVPYILLQAGSVYHLSKRRPA